VELKVRQMKDSQDHVDEVHFQDKIGSQNWQYDLLKDKIHLILILI
jgi:hypothetical protein